MALHSFCGILTLQVGVAMIAVVFWVIAALTFVVNFFEFFEGDSFPVCSLTISTFVILLIGGGLIAFFAAYNESNSLCMAGVALTSLLTVIWVTFSSLSFYNDQSILSFICEHQRCPETFWLAPLKYRLQDLQTVINKSVSYYDYDYSTFTSTEKSSTEGRKTERRKREYDASPRTLFMIDYNDNEMLKKDKIKDSILSYYDLESDASYINDEVVDHMREDPPIRDPAKSGYIFGFPLIGAVILFIINFFFLLFSILVLWSYGQELAWTNAYLQDIPEYTHA